MKDLRCNVCGRKYLATDQCIDGRCGHLDCIGAWWDKAQCVQCGHTGLELVG